MDRFVLKVEIDRRIRQYQVEKLPDSEGFERFRVSGANKSIILRTNRPLIRGKGLKTKRPSWEVVNGSVSRSSSGMEKIQTALLKIIDKSTQL